MFYLAKVGKKYIRVTPNLNVKLVDISKASYWTSKRAINTWTSAYDFKIVKAGLIEK